MTTKIVKILNSCGLHARPAAMFISEAKKYQSALILRKGQKTINGKSIILLLSCGICQNDEIELTLDGPDEKEAMEALVNLINTKFGEQ